MKNIKFPLAVLLLISIFGCEKSTTNKVKLPEQQNRWVNSITLSPNTSVKYIGKTEELIITQSTAATNIDAPKVIAIGDEINGIRIGSIKCMFFNQNAGEGKGQYMWIGKWGCMAGRSEHELQTAVRDDGVKIFDYIYVAPVTLE